MPRSKGAIPNHLGRALVTPGTRVARGQPIALSGSSGVDCVMVFPWTSPHVHFNVWLDGKNVDPFAAEGETSMWLEPNDPKPFAGPNPDDAFEPTAWDDEAVARAVASCRDPKLRAELQGRSPSPLRAMDTLFALNYFPTRFDRDHRLYRESHERRAMLDLPFRAEDFDGVVFPYE